MFEEPEEYLCIARVDTNNYAECANEVSAEQPSHTVTNTGIQESWYENILSWISVQTYK